MIENVERRGYDRRVEDAVSSTDEGDSRHDKLDAWRSNMIALVIDWRRQLGGIASNLNNGDSSGGLLSIRDVASQIDEAARSLLAIHDDMTEQFNVQGSKLEESIWDGRKG